MTLKDYSPIFDALVLLMKPMLEVVVHELATDRICYINGNLSKRQVGDPSLLDVGILKENLDQRVYIKINFDGRLIKSISIPLEQKWLLCINLDVSLFSQIKDWALQMLKPDMLGKPISLFKNDWEDKLYETIFDFTKSKNWQVESLTQSQKKEIIEHLFKLNAFFEKNAAQKVAQVLKMGRATVFNYLKKWRKK